MDKLLPIRKPYTKSTLLALTRSLPGVLITKMNNEGEKWSRWPLAKASQTRKETCGLTIVKTEKRTVDMQKNTILSTC